MIPKNSPEGQFLTVCWRVTAGIAGAVSEQYRWMLTGIAAILGVIVANLDSISKVILDERLAISVCLLVASVLLASIAYILSTALKLRNEVSVKLEQVLGSEEAQHVFAKMTIEQSQLRRELCSPYFGPMKWVMASAAKRGAADPYALEKGGIRLLVWQAYAMWLSMILASAALVVLVSGLK